MTGVTNSPWRIPGITQRLIALHRQPLSMKEIADRLSFEFEVKIGRNSVIGRSRRLGLRGRPDKELTPPPKSAIARFAPIAPVIDEAPAGGGGKTLLQLGTDDCHWPQGNHPVLFCGKPSAEGRAYCAEHCNRAYNRPNKVWA